MRRENVNLLVTCFLSAILLITGCKKEDPPTVTTSTVSEVTINSAIAGGSVTDDGGADITSKGVCWSTQQLPTTSDNMTNDGTGTGVYTSNLTGLQEGTTYYVRAYATNSEGTSYGDEVSFSTGETTTATITTADVTAITTTSGVTGGNVSDDGQLPVTARGVVWGTSPNPTVEGTNKGSQSTDGEGTGEFISTLSGLTEGTTYYVRAYATNSKGTAYGNEVTFTTAAVAIPTVTTAPVTGITSNGGVTGGNVTSEGGADVTARGVVWGTAANPTVSGSHTTNGQGTGAFVSNLTGLNAGTTYHVRAYATNSKGTAYGNDVTFSTSSGLATVTTAQFTTVTPTGATLSGTVTNNGSATVTERGMVWSTSPNPTVTNNKVVSGNGSGTFTTNITGLANGSVYYIRSFATNSAGTAYGNQRKLVTSLVDVEGNVYRATQIGNQIWMADNLKTTRFRNNEPIPQVTDDAAWIAMTTPAYTWYNNNGANKDRGGLYNWYTVETGNLCPQGWHVPTDAEFATMEVAAGVPADSVSFWGWRGTQVGTKLKDSIGWTTGAGTNELGFSATGSGYRAWNSGQFRGINEIVYYWTATDDAANAKPLVGYYRRLDGATHYIFKATTNKPGGKSIRCVKN
jgi:uncharacterized protein (TIGR02145 family)